MAAHISVPRRPRLLSVTGSCYDYQFEQWPRPPEVPLLRLRGIGCSRPALKSASECGSMLPSSASPLFPAHAP